MKSPISTGRAELGSSVLYRIDSKDLDFLVGLDTPALQYLTGSKAIRSS